jgi:hypothetical protein
MRKIFIAFGVLGIALIVAGHTYAGTIQLTSASQLSPTDTVLTFPGATGPVGTTDNTSPVSFAAGGNTLSFTASTSVNGAYFENDTVGVSYFETAFGSGTNLLYAAGYNGATAPITLSFANPVTEVGFNAEEFADGPYTISFTAYNGATDLGTFTASGYDPANGEAGGVLSFEGLDSTGGITSLNISDGNGDNIALGPITFGGTVTSTPEPGSLTLIGTGLLGLMLAMRKRISVGH